MNISNGNKEYKSKSHLIYSCQYHIIFCPKYRRQVLSKEYDFEIVEMEVMPDHVHLLVDCNPRFGIMDCVTKLKGTSSKILRDEFPWLKSRIPTLWTRSAFISTVGAVSLDVVKKYIEEQKNV